MNKFARFFSWFGSFGMTIAPEVHFAQERAPSPIPVLRTAPTVVSLETFNRRPAARGLPGERILVNDLDGKRLLVLDSSLATFTLTADSARVSGVLYPNTPYAYPLIRYAGDSSLIIDHETSAFLVVDQDGRIAHPMAHPVGKDLQNVRFAGQPASDQQGRLFYTTTWRVRPPDKAGDSPRVDTRDTAVIVRVDFDRRVVDTIAQFTLALGDPPKTFGVDEKGKTTAIMTLNPYQGGPDEWAVLADGTLAILRENDYHVDFFGADGTKWSGPRMPFDWRRITDEEKTARIDSMNRALDSIARSTGRPHFTIIQALGGDGARARYDTIVPTIKYVPLSAMPDYVPPIRSGALRADADNNLWILPTTSSQVGPGLLYDVVNRRGILVERVRLPVDHVLLGFGRGGVLILGKFEPASKKWRIARTRVLR